MVRQRPLAVVPAASVIIEQAAQVIPQSRREPVELAVTVRSNLKQLQGGVLEVHVARGMEGGARKPGGKPQRQEFGSHLPLPSDQAGRKAGTIPAAGNFVFPGRTLRSGFSVVTREDLGTVYHYQPAAEDISLVNVAFHSNPTVGYLMGAGDDIPNVLNRSE